MMGSTFIIRHPSWIRGSLASWVDFDYLDVRFSFISNAWGNMDDCMLECMDRKSKIYIEQQTTRLLCVL